MTNDGLQVVNQNMAQLNPEMPHGYLKVYNAGMVMFTKKGMQLVPRKICAF